MWMPVKTIILLLTLLIQLTVFTSTAAAQPSSPHGYDIAPKNVASDQELFRGASSRLTIQLHRNRVSDNETARLSHLTTAQPDTEINWSRLPDTGKDAGFYAGFAIASVVAAYVLGQIIRKQPR